MKSYTDKILAYFMALFLSLGVGVCFLKIPLLSAWMAARGNSNLLLYGMVIVLFSILFFLFLLLAGHFPSDRRDLILSKITIPVVILLSLSNLLFFIFMIELEINIVGGNSTLYLWHKLPLPFWLGFLTAEILIFFGCIRSCQVTHISQWYLYLLYAVLSVAIAYMQYTPDIFVRGVSDRHHANAYYNSIYTVLHGIPYSDHMASVYGHYGILYSLPMKLLGGDYIDFIYLICLLQALCFLAMFVALHLMVKSNLLRILGSIAMSFPMLAMRGGFYWQLWPHRIIFMSLLICLGAFCVSRKRCNALTCTLGYLLSLLAIVWNTESGLFCAIAWSAFWIIQYLGSDRCSLMGTLKAFALHIGAAIFSFLGAYAVVAVYNILAGGTAGGISQMVFPLLSGQYMTDVLRLDLPLFPSGYMTVLVLLLLTVAWGISQIRIFTPDGHGRSDASVTDFAFFVSVLTLGQVSYFMNRAAYHNLDICFLPALLLLCLLAQRGLNTVHRFHWKQRQEYSPAAICRGAFSAMVLVILLTITTGNFAQFGYNLEVKTQFQDKDGIHDFAAHIAAHIPENTYAFGIGTAELYSMLRWDTGCYTLDFPDLGLLPEAGDSIIEDIKSKDLPGFLAGENAMAKLEHCSSDGCQWLKEQYEISQEFEFEGAVLKYYTRK